VTVAFLKVNGYQLEFDDLEAFSFLIGLYESGTMQFTELEKSLRVHSRREHRDSGAASCGGECALCYILELPVRG
jgi:prophage maintenance system killer protein